MSILLVIPGFGTPHLEEKFAFLQQNLAIFAKSKRRVDVVIFYYSVNVNSDRRFEEVKQSYTNGTIRVIKEKGVLGQFIYKYITADCVREYDYVALLLDDILLQANVDIDIMIDIYTSQKINLISPSLHPSSKIAHRKMAQDTHNKVGRYLNMIEFFFYLMSRENYLIYHSVFTEKTKWMWGIPRLFHAKGWRMALLDNMSMIHYYVGGSASGREEYAALRKKYGNRMEREFKLLGYLSLREASQNSREL